MSEKTEMPTPKRLRDAREKGQLLFSREVVSVATFFGVLGALLIGFPNLSDHIVSMLRVAMGAAGATTEEEFRQALSLVVGSVALFFLFGTALAVTAAVASGLAANLIQIGFYFSFAKLTKGFQALNPISNAKNMFAKKSLYMLLLNMGKVAMITAVGWFLMLHQLPSLMSAIHCGLACVSELGVRAMLSIAVTLGLLFVVLAVLDYLMQRHFYLAELKMSIDEVKREFKETEGSPEIKSYRKQAHKEAANEQMLSGVEDASAVIKNPEHYAVAFQYNEATTPLPFITAKGQGALAQAILTRAAMADVPVIENPPLARGLYHDADLHDFIPSEFFRPVAEVLRYIAAQQKQ